MCLVYGHLGGGHGAADVPPAQERTAGNDEKAFRLGGRGGHAYEFKGVLGIGDKQGAKESERLAGAGIDETDHFYPDGDDLSLAQEVEGTGIDHFPPEAGAIGG